MWKTVVTAATLALATVLTAAGCAGASDVDVRSASNTSTPSSDTSTPSSDTSTPSEACAAMIQTMSDHIDQLSKAIAITEHYVDTIRAGDIAVLEDHASSLDELQIALETSEERMFQGIAKCFDEPIAERHTCMDAFESGTNTIEAYTNVIEASSEMTGTALAALEARVVGKPTQPQRRASLQQALTEHEALIGAAIDAAIESHEAFQLASEECYGKPGE